MRSPILTLVLLAFFTRPLFADDAKELPPIKRIERVLPPKGIEVPAKDLQALEDALIAAQAKVYVREKGIRLPKVKLAGGDEEKAPATPADGKAAAAPLKPAAYNDLKPDFDIYFKAVRFAIDFGEFYNPKDLDKAHAAIRMGLERAQQLLDGKHPWTDQRGLLVRGYRSEIDDSVQPYGLHIPEKLDLTKPVPLLVWLHGRGDKETDLHFIAAREKSKGEFAPDWCITLHPYGRGTIGFKFAGEIDVLDAIESVKKRYKIDEDRIALAGFSMGGAGAWHIGAHYADKFCVVHAGAGFVETAKYNRLTPDKYPAWYEQKLWGWYDVPCYTRNLFNVPVIAYSGENDKQIQAAREMEAAFKAEGRELNHIIGPGVEHKYEAKAKEEILRQIKAAVEKGREKWPKKVSLQTRTLLYSKMHWIQIGSMEESWRDARVDATANDKDQIDITTRNVDFFTLTNPWAKPLQQKEVIVHIDGQRLAISSEWFVSADDGVMFVKNDGRWIDDPLFDPAPNRKWALPGPIDHAFMSPFIVAEPKNLQLTSPQVERWIRFEFERFKRRWREVFRGDVRILDPGAIKESDTRKFNLVIWGRPAALFSTGDQSEKPPERWDSPDAIVADPSFDWSKHVAILIYPRSLTPGRYIVLNSGPTFREGHDRTNSQQTPKLPDWAIIGLDKDPDAFAPGEIKAAGFFDENWKVKKDEEKKSK